MAKPAKALLTKYGRHASHAGAFQNLCVGYFVLPLDAQNTPQAPQMKAVEFLLMSLITNCVYMVTEIQFCVNSTNQHAQCPSPTPESSGPLKKFYLVSRDFLRGKYLPRTLFRSWFLRWKHTEYRPKVPSSWGKFLRWKRG